MDASIISKIHKAREYAEDRSRFCFEQLRCEFRGTNASHRVAFEGGTWRCDCHYFEGHSFCAHTMAIERLLDGMMPAEASSHAQAQA